MKWSNFLAVCSLLLTPVSNAESASTESYLPSLPLALLIAVVAILFILTKEKKSKRKDG